MSHSINNQPPYPPNQLIRMFRLRSGGNSHKKMRQVDMAALVGVDTRTLQQWENGERLPGSDSLQRLIRVLVAKNLFLPGEERREARHLWEMVRQAFDERPGSYRLYPLFDEQWFTHVLRTSEQEPAETSTSSSPGERRRERQSSSESGDDGGIHQTPTNLSAQRTSFIGRAREITEIKRLLATTALITLTGPGGCGKTRLALHIAASLLDVYTDGVWFVELATLTDPALVPNVIAHALTIQEQPGISCQEALTAFLRTRHALLILDNCEHLVTSCATLVEQLLAACPTVQIVITSREALNIAEETIWRIPSLSLPTLQPLSTQEVWYESAVNSEAVQLFVERSRNAQPHFELTKENALAITQICQQLEGIPLALELAAARMNVFTPEQIAVRLRDRFLLLTAGRRTAMPRHQTLRAVIDWSFLLLSEKERTLFRRLSVFVGGYTLEAVETICAWPQTITDGTNEINEPEEILDLLTQLVNKSLVIVQPSATGNYARYRLLETMRWYGQEQLEEQRGQISQEGLRLRERHARFYADFIEQAERALRSSERETRLGEIREEYENLRAALQWSVRPEGDPSVSVRIAGALYWFWLHEGAWSEGRSWLKKAIAAVNTDENSANYARALHGLGILAWAQGDISEATSLAQRSIAVARQAGNNLILATSLRLLVQILLSQDDLENAQNLAEQSVLLTREQEDTWNLASSLSTLGTVLLTQRLYNQAQQLYEESLELFERSGDHWEQTGPLRNLGHLAFLQGNYDKATVLYKKSIVSSRHIRGTWFLARGLEGLAKIACAQSDYQRAVTLLAAAAQQREILGAVVLPTSYAEHAQTMRETKRALDPEVFEQIWHRRKAMSIEQTIRYALQDY